jgi:integrase
VTSLTDHLEQYLAMRRALGFKLERHGKLLADFVQFCTRRDEERVSVDAAIAWASLPTTASPVWLAERLSVVRGFARWLHALDPRHEIPPTRWWSAPARRRAPYLYSPQELSALLAGARAEPEPLRAATFETLIALLAVTGLRPGEAMALDREDLDTSRRILLVRNTKFGKSRLVPIHPTTLEALDHYGRRRDRLCPSPRDRALLLSPSGERLRHSTVQPVFRRIVRRAGIDGNGQRSPRLHDLRHGFAVATLEHWHASGVDVNAALPKLSAYLGHRDPASSYWYLSGTPELLAHGVARLEATFEAAP